MKYKVLLAGNSKKIISSFFMQMDMAFECMTSSILYDDLKNHVQYFQPDIFVLCMRSETRDDLVTVGNFHEVLSQNNIPFGAIGDSPSLDFASKIPNCTPDLSMKLPISTSDMQQTITDFIREYKTNLSLAKNSPIKSPSSENTSSGSVFDALSQLDSMFDDLEKPLDETEYVFGEQLFADLDRKRILIVDDATIIHKTIKGYLDSKYEVSTAISGKIALRFLKTKEVNLILLDYDMPEMDGPTVLAKLREDPKLTSIPVIFLTGINDVDKIKNVLALKPQGYLLKPVDKNTLLQKIHDLIG